MAHSRVRAESDAVLERIDCLTGDGKHEVERYIIYPRILRELYGERNIVPAAESAERAAFAVVCRLHTHGYPVDSRFSEQSEIKILFRRVKRIDFNSCLAF